MAGDNSSGKGESRLSELLEVGQQSFHLMLDPRVPLMTKLIPLAALVYLLSPIDLIPDTIPLLTQIDDLAVLIIAARLFVEMVPDDIMSDDGDGDAGEDETVSTTYRVHE